MRFISNKRVLHILVATAIADLTAEVISAAIARCADMDLLGGRVVSLLEIESSLLQLPPCASSALVIVGHARDTEEIERRCLARYAGLAVYRIDTCDDLVRATARRVGMNGLLGAMRELADESHSADAQAAGSHSLAG
jgi:hypothetical protein